MTLNSYSACERVWYTAGKREIVGLCVCEWDIIFFTFLYKTCTYACMQRAAHLKLMTQNTSVHNILCVNSGLCFWKRNTEKKKGIRLVKWLFFSYVVETMLLLLSDQLCFVCFVIKKIHCRLLIFQSVSVQKFVNIFIMVLFTVLELYFF